jgi:maltooligosyltrehalose trehalohydrolase
LQNHDQVANTTRGERCSVSANPALVRALTALTLLGPQTPMLFMGQEIAATQPFPFFADHTPELASSVHSGRREFLSQFRSSAGESARAAVPDPADPRTFEAAKLDVGEHRRDTPSYRLHRDLLRLRREQPSVAQQSRGSIDGAVLTEQAFVLRWLDSRPALLLAVNLGTERFQITGSEPLLACDPDEEWAVLWSSEHPDYGGGGVVSPVDSEGWSLPGMTAVLLHAVHASQ